METRDWLGVYGALLSSVLAAREVWKHRRATMPKLTAFIRRTPATRVITELTPLGNEQRGESRLIIVHNRGGADTVILGYRLFIAPRWVPSFLLGMLGSTGRLPEVKSNLSGAVFQLEQISVSVPAGADGEIREILWPDHRSALDRGDLMLSVVHSWSRDRPQQIRVRQFT
jgi:hypothetical protein